MQYKIGFIPRKLNFFVSFSKLNRETQEEGRSRSLEWKHDAQFHLNCVSSHNLVRSFFLARKSLQIYGKISNISKYIFISQTIKKLTLPVFERVSLARIILKSSFVFIWKCFFVICAQLRENVDSCLDLIKCTCFVRVKSITSCDVVGHSLNFSRQSCSDKKKSVDNFWFEGRGHPCWWKCQTKRTKTRWCCLLSCSSTWVNIRSAFD